MLDTDRAAGCCFALNLGAAFAVVVLLLSPTSAAREQPLLIIEPARIASRPASPQGFPPGAPVKVSGPISLEGDVKTFAINDDATRIVFLANATHPNVDELYSVPINGGPVVKLNAALPIGGDVLSYRISPSGTVVYLANQAATVELYSVPIGGGTATKINGPLVAGGDLTGLWAISPDGSRVVYSADQDVDNLQELYSVPIGGGPVTKISGQPGVGSDVFGFAIAPDGTRVVYHADHGAVGVNELFSVPIAGGSVVKLNATPVPGGDVSSTSLISIVGRVVFLGDLETDTVVEAYSVPIAGGPVVKLNGPLILGGDVTHVALGLNQVVYRADQDTDGVFELYSVPAAGGPSIKITPPLVLNGDVTVQLVQAPVDVAAVYTADQDTASTLELYTVPLGGGISTKLSGPMGLIGDVFSFLAQVTVPGSLPKRVFYLADPNVDGRVEAFSVLLPSGPWVQVNAPLIPGGHVTALSASDSGFIVYRANQDVLANDELYFARSDGAGPVTQLNVNPVAGGNIREFSISQPPRVVVYRADQDTDEIYELYARLLDGDADGDQVSDAIDCFVIDGAVWDNPGEVTLLDVSHEGGVGGTTTFSWSAPTPLGGTSVKYDVLRSSQPNDFVTSTICVESDVSDTLATDSTSPSAGEVFHYWVRAENICGAGEPGVSAARTCP